MSTQTNVKELQELVKDSGMELTFTIENTIVIYWQGVIKLEASATDTAKAIHLFRDLSKLGATSC